MRTTFYIDAQQSLDLETIDELLQSSRKIDLTIGFSISNQIK